MTTEQIIFLAEQTKNMKLQGLAFLASQATAPDNENPLAPLAGMLRNRGMHPKLRIVLDSETIGLIEQYQALYVPQNELEDVIPLQQEYLSRKQCRV